MKSKKKCLTAFNDCEKRACFQSVNNNGVTVCRLYGLGKCKGTSSAKFPLFDEDILEELR